MSISRKRLNSEESRSAALEAARLLLLEQGPQAVTLKAVAAKVGRTHANLLHHFGSAAGLQAELARSIADRVTDSQVTHWHEAMPYVPVGHATAVQRYRDRLLAASPVLLAGDYLGFPWTDSAAFNGHWAADRLIADHGG